jgi:hypothetical protein
MGNRLLSIIVILASVFVIGPILASATPYNYDDAFGGHATFDVINSTQLNITLWSTRDPANNAEVLIALFFSGPVLTPISATVPTGNIILTWPSTTYTLPSPRDVGHEWAYKSALSGIPGGGTQGLSSAGLNVFGPPDIISPGSTDWYVGGNDPNGGDYGLTDGNHVTSNGYGELVKNTTEFVLGGLPPGFNPTGGITNVYIHYGTTLETTPVPEPATMLLLGAGLLGLAGYGRKKFLKK